jgi:polysaccharide biosynthesis/export protein
MNKLLTVSALLVTAPFLLAQDPGFRPSQSATKPAAATPTNSNTAVVSGANMLTSMEMLDTTRPVQPGYVISIRVREDGKDAVQQKVAITGEVQVPYVGLVRAQGRTCRELAYSIKRDLEKSFFITATVLITIDSIPDDDRTIRGVNEIESYTMFGQVLRQGKYDLPMNQDLTISQAILVAGGFAQFADTEHVKIVRTTPQGEKNILVNVDSIMRKGLMQHDIYLRKNDVIIVMEKTINF